MASETSIINQALVKLGVATISDRTDDAPQARVANRTFDELRDDMLRDHPWNWAIKRVSITSSTTDPAWGFDNAYTLPSDYMRLLELYNPSRYDYRIESTSDGKVIVTDLGSPIKIRYVAHVTSVDQWDVKFREALSARCAAEWAEALTENETLAAKLQKEYVVKLRDAKAVDGQEDSISEIEVYPWISSRY